MSDLPIELPPLPASLDSHASDITAYAEAAVRADRAAVGRGVKPARALGLKIYVAGASAEPARVRAAMTAVQKLGYELTLDWLAVIEREGAANEGLDDEKRRRFADDDIDAVETADVVWVLAPTPPLASTGAWVELGYALALRTYRAPSALGIFVSGPGRERCIFAVLARTGPNDSPREFRTDEEVLEVLARGARELFEIGGDFLVKTLSSRTAARLFPADLLTLDIETVSWLLWRFDVCMLQPNEKGLLRIDIEHALGEVVERTPTSELLRLIAQGDSDTHLGSGELGWSAVRAPLAKEIDARIPPTRRR